MYAITCLFGRSYSSDRSKLSGYKPWPVTIVYRLCFRHDRRDNAVDMPVFLVISVHTQPLQATRPVKIVYSLCCRHNRADNVVDIRVYLNTSVPTPAIPATSIGDGAAVLASTR